MPQSQWKGKPVGVLGAGKSGLAAARLLARWGAHVLLSESQPRLNVSVPRTIKTETGGHSLSLLKSDLIIRSPGIPHISLLKEAHRRHIPVWSELELAAQAVHPRDLVAITGTNGKTTTTTLVGELFKAAGRRTFVVGNIGTPLSDVVVKVTAKSSVVAEVSSYQLEDIDTFHPTLSAILNITPDHLEHHGTMQAYVAAKARIFENQTRKDVCVLNADDPACRKLAARCPARVFLFSRRAPLRQGIYYHQGDIVVRWSGKAYRWALKTQLPGPHNIENILASAALALAGGISPTVIQNVLERFRGVEHRLEVVRTLNGVRYINDSKATNVDSTRVALESFQQPLLVIMGGRGKGTPYTSLAGRIRARVRMLLFIGEDTPRLKKDLGPLVPHESCSTMANAVRRAAKLAWPGDVVLLSPACASFDQYQNYEERGRDFKSLVRRLK